MTYVADIELAHARALEVNWAKYVDAKDFSEFAAASAILMREQFGDNFTGVVQGRRAADAEIVTVALHGQGKGEIVRAFPIDSEKAARLASKTLETGEIPTNEELEEMRTSDDTVVQLSTYVRKTLQ